MAPSAVAREVSGRLTGGYADWGPLRVEALRSRDFTVPPIADAPVGADGAFTLQLPDATGEAYLALWPETLGAYPILVRELPYAIPPEQPLAIPLPSPPKRRGDRHAAAGPSLLLVAGGLLALVWLLVGLGRAWLARRTPPGPDRWLPPPPADVPGGWPLVALAAVVAGLLLYGTLALGEALDLLEYTYFQEGFAGRTPWEVALSPVVAERAHAPGYAVLLWALGSLTVDERWLRIPALLAAVGAVVCLYRLAAGATGRRSVGLAAAALGAFAPLAMRYGRDVTPYSLVGLLSVATTWALYRALSTGRRRDFGTWAGLSTLAFFLHYFTAFLLVGQALAVLFLWFRGGRGPVWSRRLAQALLWFGVLAVLPSLWAAQVIRAFVISAQDNLVTHAVYPEAPGFLPYVLEHVRVLVALPSGWSVLAIPAAALVAWGLGLLWRDHPALAALLVLPLLLVLALLVTTYLLHSYAYGGRIYYGWRWLRPYVPAIALPLAYLGLAARRGRWIGRIGAGLLFVSALGTGGASTLRWERPAQIVAAERLRGDLKDGDAIAVLPAAFYTMSWAWYLHDRDLRFVHAGPSTWHRFSRGDGTYALAFGPIRSFGLPLETLVGHPDVHRLWVTVFRESIFGQPEFDPALPDHVLAHLDTAMVRRHRLSYPFLDLVLYEARPALQGWDTPIRVDLGRLYRSTRLLPDALDPDALFRIVRGERPLRLRLVAPPAGAPFRLRVLGVPPDATAEEIRLEQATFDGAWTARIQPTRSDRVELVLHRSPRALRWPLRLELSL